jgi:hypothetical protein
MRTSRFKMVYSSHSRLGGDQRGGILHSNIQTRSTPRKAECLSLFFSYRIEKKVAVCGWCRSAASRVDTLRDTFLPDAVPGIEYTISNPVVAALPRIGSGNFLLKIPSPSGRHPARDPMRGSLQFVPKGSPFGTRNSSAARTKDDGVSSSATAREGALVYQHQTATPSSFDCDARAGLCIRPKLRRHVGIKRYTEADVPSRSAGTAVPDSDLFYLLTRKVKTYRTWPCKAGL